MRHWLKHLALLQERDFTVYEPFCANYAQALDIIVNEAQNIMVCCFFLARLADHLVTFCANMLTCSRTFLPINSDSKECPRRKTAF